MRALLISPDPALRDQLRVGIRSLDRRAGPAWEYLEAADGVEGLKIAWRELPDLVVADEIASRAGGFHVARDLRNAERPFKGGIVLVLERRQDEWLARWSGADAWFTKPVDPFALADTVEALVAAHTARRNAG